MQKRNANDAGDSTSQNIVHKPTGTDIMQKNGVTETAKSFDAEESDDRHS